METKRAPGPWMVFVRRYEDGGTAYKFAEHSHAAIAMDREYWPDWHTPETDGDGYFQPDDLADIADYRIANARLIAAAPELLEALREMLELRTATQEGRITEKHELDIVRDARSAIAKATGHDG